MAADKLGDVVIVGGGIIGCSIAYHLSELGVKSIVVERCSVACGASGKAGGFLARTWCDGGASGALARASFDLHKKYGEMFDCDYRALDTLGVSVSETNKRKGSLSSAPDWLDRQCVLNVNKLGDTSDTAQVHPEKLCKSFMNAAQKNGSKLIIGQAVGIELSNDRKKVTGLRLHEKKTIPCDTLIVAMGPWTNTASQWFQYNIPQIKALRAHSIVMKPANPVTPHALFVEYKKSKECLDPEVYPRPDGTVYMCGYSDHEVLPESADLVTPKKESVKDLHKMASNISTTLEGSEVITEQACYLPIPPAGTPVIGCLPGFNGQVYIAAGHYCWGILNAPATGKGLAELMVNGSSEIDLSPFDPANFM